MRLAIFNETLDSPDVTLNPTAFSCDEEDLPDERNDIRPSEVVQSKLLKILPKGMPIPVSCDHFQRPVRR